MSNSIIIKDNLIFHVTDFWGKMEAADAYWAFKLFGLSTALKNIDVLHLIKNVGYWSLEMLSQLKMDCLELTSIFSTVSEVVVARSTIGVVTSSLANLILNVAIT